MHSFSNLPTELLPSILQHIIRPNHLAELCLVNNAFYAFTAPVLYRRAFIYSWHKDGKSKVVKLFRTLSEHPELAKYVVQLCRLFFAQTHSARSTDFVFIAVRDFPKAVAPAERDNIMAICLRGLQNCTNLTTFLWTRDGSLSTSILDVLSPLPHLAELEINGHSDGHYDPAVLLQLNRLRKITLILPGSGIMDILPVWAARTAGTLRHLTLIWQSTTLLTDQVLSELSCHLNQLESLYLVGCPKVSHHGLWSIVSANEGRLQGLGMEVLNSSFDLLKFSELCIQSAALRSLQSISIHMDVKSASPSWQRNVVDLLSKSPVESFHISSLAGEAAVNLPDDFCAEIVDAHSRTLRKFSVDRMRLSMASIKYICERCTGLERLFVVMQHEDMNELAVALSFAQNLRAFHATRSLGSESEEALVVPEQKILSLVRKCSWKLKQIGFYTRVKQVDRVTFVDEDGSIHIEPRLVPFESPEIPEPFLVVRT
ncbi:hypothetical protein BDW22DRAFT_1408085 [Trametopsis cervina]|nr:hypothetical protein BDW22DRAFT_1408085 [Trametopsis cervina]